jgi:CRP/FNR family transcriptional regulator
VRQACKGSGQSGPEKGRRKTHRFVLMLSGSKRVFKASESGREITLYEMGAGDMCVLNASSLLSGTKLPASAESLSDVEMLLLSKPEFIRLMSEYVQMQSFVFRRVSQSLATIMSLISEVSFARMDERLAESLLEKSENNILNKAQRVIANDLGTSREVVSRLLKDFERRGVSSYPET